MKTFGFVTGMFVAFLMSSIPPPIATKSAAAPDTPPVCSASWMMLMNAVGGRWRWPSRRASDLRWKWAPRGSRVLPKCRWRYSTTFCTGWIPWSMGCGATEGGILQTLEPTHKMIFRDWPDSQKCSQISRFGPELGRVLRGWSAFKPSRVT